MSRRAVPPIEFPEAMDLMAFGFIKDRIMCPFCGGWKSPFRWTCGECYQKFGYRGQLFIKQEVCHVAVGKCKGFMWNWLMFPLNGGSSQTRKRAGAGWSRLKNSDCEDDSFFVLDPSIPVRKMNPEKSLLQNSGDAISSSSKMDMRRRAQELLSGIKVNFREEGKAAQALFAFLLFQFEAWRVAQEKVGKSALQPDFFQEVSYSIAFFFGLRNQLQGSLTKAKEVASFHQFSLEGAVSLGLEIVQSAGILEKETASLEGSKEREVILSLLGKVRKNLREDSSVAKAFAAAIDALFEKQRELGIPGVRDYCKEKSFSYDVLLCLRKGGTEKLGLSLKRARKVADKMEVSLEEMVAQGAQILDVGVPEQEKLSLHSLRSAIKEIADKET